MKLAEVHPIAWARLRTLANGPAHALLLHGAPGLLKTGLAHELAAALLCEAPVASGACGRCNGCNWFDQGNHPDFRFVRPDADAAEDPEQTSGDSGKGRASREIRVEQVRALSEFLNVGAHRGGRRVVLISPAEAMNRSAANAILKALEEPNPGVLFVLVTDDFDGLLPTIRSRCQMIAIAVPDQAASLAWLDSKAVGVQAAGALRRAGGAPGLALELGLGSQGRLVALLEKVLRTGGDSRIAAMEVERLLRSESDLEMMVVVTWVQRWLVDMVLAANALPRRYFSDYAYPSDRVCEFSLLEKINKTREFKMLSRHPLNARLFLESFFAQCVPAMSGENR